MRISRSGRFVFVAQWFLALVLWIWVVLGRGLLGVEMGWMALAGVVYSVVVVPALYIPPVLSLFDREVRAGATARSGYAVSSIVMWIALFVLGFVLPDAGDGGALPSFVSQAFGVSEEISAALCAVCAGAFLVGLLGAVAWAVAGIVRSSRTAAR